MATEERDVIRISTAAPAASAAEPQAAAPAATPATEPAATPAAEGTQPAAAPAAATPGAEPAAQPAAAPATPASDFDWIKENPIAQKALDAIKAGDFSNFAKTFGTNYDTMPDEDVVRLNLQKQNPGVSDGTIDALLKRELAKYDLKGFDSEKNEAGAELLKLDANKIRDGFKQEQAAYQAPTVQGQPQGQPADDPAMIERVNYLTSHPTLTAFETNRTLSLGSGTDALNFEPDPSINKESILNTDPWSEMWSTDAAGKQVFDMQKYIRVMNYAKNPEAVEAALIKHGKSLGAKADFVDRHNPGSRATGMPPESGRQVKVRIG